MNLIKNILNSPSLQALTLPEERKEMLIVIREAQVPLLRKEKPQSDFRGGWLEMWTVMVPFYDKNGWNREGSTFTRQGLTELGINPDSCKIV